MIFLLQYVWRDVYHYYISRSSRNIAMTLAILVTLLSPWQESPCEQVIFRDINRTFPAHDYFRETGGVGQDSLFKISKVETLTAALPPSILLSFPLSLFLPSSPLFLPPLPSSPLFLPPLPPSPLFLPPLPSSPPFPPFLPSLPPSLPISSLPLSFLPSSIIPSLPSP